MLNVVHLQREEYNIVSIDSYTVVPPLCVLPSAHVDIWLIWVGSQ